MSYASTTNVTDRMETTTAARLTTADSSTTPDLAIIQAHIDGAERLMDSYFATRYKVPIDTTINPGLVPLLRECSIDLSIYEIYNKPGKGVVPKDVTLRRDNRIKWLESIAKGVAELPAATSEIEAPSTQGTTSVFASSTPVMGRSNLSGL